jgi:hypothetical protein
VQQPFGDSHDLVDLTFMAVARDAKVATQIASAFLLI